MKRRKRFGPRLSATSPRLPSVCWQVARRRKRRSLSLRFPRPSLERIADVPIYATDAVVRRSSALQMTADARPPMIGVPSELAAERGIADGMPVRVTQGGASIVLPARIDASLASNVLRIAAAHPLTAALGPMFGPLELSVESSARSGVATAASAA